MILVTGATGFVGSRVVAALRAKEAPVRGLARNPKHSARVTDTGAEFLQGDITEKTGLSKALEGVETVINLVGIIRERPGVTHDDVSRGGMQNLLEAGKKAGSLKRVVYNSALGTTPTPRSLYFAGKWAAEVAIRESGLAHAIFRPSIMYGGDEAFFKEMLSKPVVPIIGEGKNRMDPLYVEDLVPCLVAAALDAPKEQATYEISGPDPLTYTQAMEQMVALSGKRKKIVHVPKGIMGGMARLLGNMPVFPVTEDQLKMLELDLIADNTVVQQDFNLTLTPFEEGMRRWLGTL